MGTKDVEVKRFKEGEVEFTHKTRRKPLNELESEFIKQFEPSYIDFFDDAPKHLKKYIQPERLKKELHHLTKWPKFQSRTIAAIRAKRAAKKLKDKHPKWTNEEILNHPTVKKWFPEDMRPRSKRRILSEDLPPGKPGRPPKRKPKKIKAYL